MVLEMSPRTLVRVFLRRKFVFLIVASGIVAAAAIYLVLATPQYESDADVLVNVGSQDIAAPVLSGSAPEPQTGSDMAKSIVNSQALVMKSVDVVRSAIEQVGIDRLYPTIAATAPDTDTAMAAAVDRVIVHDLDVRVAKETNILEAAVQNPRADVAQQYLGALIRAFMGKQAEATREPRLGFLNEQLADLSRQVDVAQQAMLAYKRQSGIGSLDQERELVLKQRDAIEQSVSAALAQLESAKGREAALTAALAATPPTIPLDNENDGNTRELGDASARLAAAEARYRAAQQTYAPGNVLLQDARSQLDLARADYGRYAGASTARVRTGVNTVYQTLQTAQQQAHADAVAFQNAVDTWRTQLAAINGRVDHFNAVEGRMLELQRKLDVATQNYTTYLGRAEAAKISDDLNNARITSVAVVQRPTLPLRPGRPKTKLILVLAVVVGLVAGASCCLLLELYDDRISLYPQFDELAGLPILAALPLTKAPSLRLR
jgi:uncharacterized protein involved in exopolysaccharide biosynthesis